MVGVLEKGLRSILSEFRMDQMASLLPFLSDRLTFRCLNSCPSPLGQEEVVDGPR